MGPNWGIVGPKSKRIVRHFQTMNYWYEGLATATCCWRAKQVGIEFTEEENKKLWEASAKLDEAKRIVSDIYSARIGKAVVEEIRIGEFK